MFRALSLLPDRQGLLVQRFGLGQSSLSFEKPGSVAQAQGDIGMLSSQDSFPNGLGLLVECFGFGVPTLIKDQVGEVIQDTGQNRILFALGFSGGSQSLGDAWPRPRRSGLG